MNQSPVVNQPAIVDTLPPPTSRGAAPRPEPPLKDVLVELWHDFERLVQQEKALARAEVEEKLRKLRTDAIGMAAGAGLMVGGGLALLATIILLLALVMPAWAAALITSVVLLASGFVLLKANKPTASDVRPDRTLKNLKRDLYTVTESTK